MIFSIRTKMLAITIGTVIVALALTSSSIYLIIRADNLEAIKRNLDSIATGNIRAIAEWASAKRTILKTAAAEVEPGDAREIVRYLQKAGDFALASAGWENKSFVSTTTTLPKNYDPTTRPWYQDSIRTGSEQITKPYKSATGVALVSFTAPIFRQEKQIGVVAGGVSLASVRNVILTIRPTPSSLAFVVDRDGTIIAYPGAEWISKPVSELSGTLQPSELSKLEASSDLLRAELHGEPKLLRVRPIPGTSWYLVIALDEREAMASLGDILRASTVVIVSLTLAVTLLSALLTARLLRRLSDVRNAMNDIGSGTGDLTRRLPVSGDDELTNIAKSFNEFVGKIESTIKQIHESTQTISGATVEIEAGNQDLSRRTEVVAAHLQETCASLGELASAVNMSADATVQATRLARSASQTAAQGQNIMAAVVSTMNDIASSSANAVEIIRVIDTIAFQTNILALNAAVEAARAGESGRGFAVVAEEVRNLAQRSAVAAQEIKNLIALSQTNVVSGASRVSDAGQSMNEIVKGIEHVTGIIGDISVSLSAQSSGIKQIHLAITEVEESTQKNNVLVEQAAAASQVLKGQASTLTSLVTTFNFNDGMRKIKKHNVNNATDSGTSIAIHESARHPARAV